MSQSKKKTKRDIENKSSYLVIIKDGGKKKPLESVNICKFAGFTKRDLVIITQSLSKAMSRVQTLGGGQILPNNSSTLLAWLA